MTDKNTRILVAMSGGVDSSVAAALLVAQGYEVIGLMMRLWSDPSSENLCCTPDSMGLARSVAQQFGFPFHTLDVKKDFRTKIVQYFINSYQQGQTPNPCVTCNKNLRWDALLQAADRFDAQLIATGHYARLQLGQNGKIQLLRGLDETKDQSYVLHGLTQQKLARTRFPLGEFTKTQIRTMAETYQLQSAQRPDSQDLCFVGNAGYRDFLVRHAPEVVDPGEMVTTAGKVVGQHQGLAFYTIGQRKGLKIAARHPLYVIHKDTAKNQLIVGPIEALGRSELIASQFNWIAGNPPQGAIRAQVKIRYKSTEIPAQITPLGPERVQIQFETALRDITPGQAAVVYDGNICLGGGFIE